MNCVELPLHGQDHKWQWERVLVSELCRVGKSTKLNRKQVFFTTCTFAALDIGVSKQSLFNCCNSWAIAKRRDTQGSVCILTEKLGARVISSHAEQWCDADRVQCVLCIRTLVVFGQCLKSHVAAVASCTLASGHYKLSIWHKKWLHAMWNNSMSEPGNS